MGCLFCGKVIGPLRLIRDDEFCSAVHRKQYKERLGRALTKIGKPEPPPAPPTHFLFEYDIHAGNSNTSGTVWEFSFVAEPVHYRRALPLEITPLVGAIPFRLPGPAQVDAAHSRSSAPPAQSSSELHLPALALHAESGLPMPGENESVMVPPAARPLPLQPAAVETMVFAIDSSRHVAASVSVIAPRLASEASPRFISRAEHARPLLVTTAPVAAKYASPAANPVRPSPGAARLPRFAVAAAQDCVEAVAAPQASNSHALLLVSTAPGAARYVSPAPESVTAPAGAARLPQFEVAAAEACFEPVPVPQGCDGHAALLVGTALGALQHASSSACSVSAPAGPARLPRFEIWAAEASFEPMPVSQACDWHAPLLVGTAPGALQHSSPAAVSVSAPAGAARLPRFEVAAAEACFEPMPVPRACDSWMASPPAEPVAAEVCAASAREHCSVPAAKLPDLLRLVVADPWMPSSVQLRPSPSAEPVSMDVWPQIAMTALPEYGELPAPLVPDTRQFQLAEQASHATPLAAPVAGLAPEAAEIMVMPGCRPELAQSGANVLQMPAFIGHEMQTAAGLAGQVTAPEAEPVESMPAFAAHQPAPMCAIPELRVPRLPAPQSEEFNVAGLNPVIAPKAHPSAPLPAAHPVTVEPIRTLFVVPPQPDRREAPAPTVAACGLVQLDFFTQRTAAVPSHKMVWCGRVTEPILPGLALHPIFERLGDAVPQKKARKAPAIAEIFQLPEAQTKARNPMVRHAIRAVAACLVLGTILWFGVDAVRIGNQTPTVNREVSIGDLALSTPSGSSSPKVGSALTSRLRAAARPAGTVARIREAISDRAAATVTDSFRQGMEAWGAASKQWAPGWSRHPDGYVQTGQLALFEPSQNYKNYHLEFFGAIENKSMGWAVRAHDKQNYYAMKLAVLEPGLRPVIAMMHYPVVGGKKGRPVQIPLNVMVHNNRPMQVEVDVRGNKLLTSIDGELVDTWIDDTLVAGGVGFFSDAGERARLYWMKISKNEDFLGHICAYVASTLGDGSRASAEMWPGEAPVAPRPQPLPAPERTQEAALAATAAGLQNRFTKDSRRAEWNS